MRKFEESFIKVFINFFNYYKNILKHKHALRAVLPVLSVKFPA